MAIIWLLSQENVFPIPRASSAGHVLDNVGSVGWKMSDEDRGELERAYRPTT